MSELKHTPGPWSLQDSHNTVVGSEGEIIAHVYYCPDDPQAIWSEKDRSLPNARLIAAAPELLEALEDLLAATEREAQLFHQDLEEGIPDDVRENMVCWSYAAHEKAEIAIANATGKERA